VHLLYHQRSRVRFVLFAGATSANLQQQHTHAVLRWPASSRPTTRISQPVSSETTTPWIWSCLRRRRRYTYTLRRGMPGSTPTRTPTHSSGRRQRCAVGRRGRRSARNLKDLHGRLAPESSRKRTDADH